MLDEILEIHAWYPPAAADVAETDAGIVAGFLAVMADLSAIAPWFAGLQARFDPEGPTYPLDAPDFVAGFEDWHSRFSQEFPEDAEMRVVPASKPFRDADGAPITRTFAGLFWEGPGTELTFRAEIPLVFKDNPDLPEQMPRLVERLAEWRACALVTAAPSVLKMKGKVFPEHHSAGFALWLPGMVPTERMDAAVARPLAGGTYIQPWPEMFNLLNAEAVARVGEVDGHLVEAGALPTLDRYGYPI